MKTLFKKISLLSLTSTLFCATAFSAVTPISVSIVPPVQFPAQDFSVTGARLAIVGKQEEMYGLDLGLIGNMTTQSFAGIAVSGLFNYNKGTTTAIGAQLAGLTNINTNKTSVYGIQAALAANINSAESKIYGVQFAAVNMSSHTTVNGAQIGIYNRAQTVRGFQIGIVNVTENLTGIQIGLLNFHRKGLFSVAPIINIGF